MPRVALALHQIVSVIQTCAGDAVLVQIHQINQLLHKIVGMIMSECVDMFIYYLANRRLPDGDYIRSTH